MKTIKFSLEGGLDDKDLRQIHDEVLRVMERTGVECTHKPTLLRLSGEQGFKVQGSRIRFAPDLVDRYMEQLRAAGAKESAMMADKITLSGPWNCFNIEDMDTGKIRATTAADVREMYKLVFASNTGAGCPVYPTDIPGPLQLLFLEKTGIETTTTRGSGMEFADRRMMEYVIEMYKAAGRKYYAMVQFPISPLRLNAEGLEIISELMGRDDVIVAPTAVPIPQAGATAPMFMPAALVQCLAEALSGLIVVDKVTNGKLRAHPSIRIDLFDMRYMTTVFASPEHIQFQLILSDVYKYFFGKHKNAIYFCCNAKHCDQQSMMERTAWVTTLALAGFRHFWLGAGQLSMDEIFSPAQFMLDHELVRYVTHLIRGVEYDDAPTASSDVIDEVGPGGNYLTHDSTVNRLRQQFESDIFPRTKVDQWRAEGEPDIWHKAVGEARKIIGTHSFRIEDGVQKELDRIYASAKAFTKC